MGYLRQIDVENFKSWRGKQVIGPFMKFNCVIGTNGSGKSNVMDAVSFVMGERAATLRVKHLRDLIHGANVGRPVSDRTSVSMHYVDNEDQEIVFSRRLCGESSEYCINGVQVSFSRYTGELEKIGIVTKAKNCLVFQGAVESIALKDPIERAKMFERICQSNDFVAQYNQKKEALMKAKEETQFNFNRKKAAIAERTQVSQEKVEAQKYQTMIDDLNQKHLDLSLAELFHNEKDIRNLKNDLAGKQEETSTKMENMTRSEQIVKDKKKKLGRLTREVQLLEKESSNQEKQLFQSRAQYMKTKVKTSHHIKKAEDVRNTLKKSLKLLNLKRQELALYQQEKAEVERARKDYENKILEEGDLQGRDIQLNEDQLQQYKELTEFARQKSAVLSQKADKLQWELRTDAEKIAFHQQRRKEVESGIKNKLVLLDDLAKRAEKLEEYINTTQASIEQYCEQEQTLSAQLEQGRKRTLEVEEEMCQVLETLGNARMDNQESKRQQRRIAMLGKLQRLHPESVYGRLYDVCSPIHKKYLLAVTKVFGHNLMAVVVTTEKVARDCISFIKEERGDPETFLPIDNLVVNHINERLREISGAKMVVDVVRINIASSASQLMKVVHFVCGNALVCETIKEARSVAFDKKGRQKTVSLDGTLFSKSGLISGGSSNLRTKARCWDDKDMTQLKGKKEKLTIELRELMMLKRKETDLTQIRVQSMGAEKRLKYTQKELENIRKKIITQSQSDISRMESEIFNLDSQIDIHQKRVEEKNSEVTMITEEISQMEDLIYLDFCAEIGVSNIREYEKEHLKRQTEIDSKRLEFEKQCTRLEAQWEYEQEQLEKQQRNLFKLEETIKKEEQAVLEQKKEESKFLDDVEMDEKKLSEMKNGLLNMTKDISLLKSDLDSKNSSLKGINKEVTSLQREVMMAESALEQKHLARHNLLLACKIQDLPITMLSGCLDEISNLQMDMGSEGTSASMSIYEREDQLIIDYSGLGAEFKNGNAEEVLTMFEGLKESIASLEEGLHQTAAPNLKALEKMREVKDKLEGLTEEFEASTRTARKCSREFEEVKAQRYQRFSKCFEHVSEVLDQIYKRICRNNSAQATLSAENQDEPYLGGISYNCVSPGKRFMSMDNLSGGEKSIAALALVFALHSFRPAPFLIMDEVDAALDRSNIDKVVSYICEESRANMQVIVISLKEEFFSKADALLGVYCHVDESTVSRILTLDLTPFPMERDGDERESGDVDELADMLNGIF